MYVNTAFFITFVRNKQNGYEEVYTYEDDGFYEYGLQLSDISTLFVDIYEDETRGTCVDAYIYELEKEWPAELIQEFLDYYSVTDTVPAYTVHFERNEGL